jgi:hypothetical protein
MAAVYSADLPRFDEPASNADNTDLLRLQDSQYIQAFQEASWHQAVN